MKGGKIQGKHQKTLETIKNHRKPLENVGNHWKMLEMLECRDVGIWDMTAIYFACDELGCLPAPDANGNYSKDLLVGVLLDWVCTLSLCFIL
jgi:hypothetical protein